MLPSVAARALETCLIVFCGFTIAFSQAAQPDAAVKETIGRAQSAYRKGDYALARRELESALAIRVDLAEAHLLLGMIVWQEGKVDDAINSVQEAIKYQPIYPDAHYVMGKLCFEKRNWKRAEEEANLVLSQYAKFPGAHVLLGDIALATSREEAALNFFEQALAQPSLNNIVANETRIKIEAVKNYSEFKANMKNKDYQYPKVVVEAQIGKGMKPIPQRKGLVVLKGVCNEQGRFTSYIVVYSTDDQIAEAFLQRVAQYQLTPAMKKGVPVPLWVIIEYKHD